MAKTLSTLFFPKLKHTHLGGQVLQAWTGLGNDILYLSPLSLDNAAPARGGVPVLFPQFADRGPLPKHGFARTMPWTLKQEIVSHAAHSVTYELAIGPRQLADWPHAARLVLQAEVGHQGLHLNLCVINTGASAFTWTGGLHPYFVTDDVQACSLTGLAGLPVQDRYDSSLRVQSEGSLYYSGQVFERLYDGCPPLTLSSGPRQLVLSASGFEQWMVWTPGRTGGDALPDLPEGGWRQFVCIEPVCVTRPVTLQPSAVFTGTLDVLSRQH